MKHVSHQIFFKEKQMNNKWVPIIPKAAFTLVFLVIFISGPHLEYANAKDQIQLSTGQTVYVPVYSHIYSGNREKPFYLATTLSIRNTDPDKGITIFSADYYDSSGELIEKYLASPRDLRPLESIRYVIKESDKTGGSGANFIVKWKSRQGVNSPVIESIMIGTQNQQGISFTSRGLVIK